jgi:hypothetical protein
MQDTSGVPDEALISPDGYTLDNYHLAPPDVDEIQLDLLLDYANNTALYPAFQEFFRTPMPPLLAIWGKSDPFFFPVAPKHSSEIFHRRSLRQRRLVHVEHRLLATPDIDLHQGRRLRHPAIDGDTAKPLRGRSWVGRGDDPLHKQAACVAVFSGFRR